MSSQSTSVVFCDTFFGFAAWISEATELHPSRVMSSMRIETGNACTNCFLDEPNARALILALEDHIKNIAKTKNELLAIQQIQKKEATA